MASKAGRTPNLTDKRLPLTSLLAKFINLINMIQRSLMNSLEQIVGCMSHLLRKVAVRILRRGAIFIASHKFRTALPQGKCPFCSCRKVFLHGICIDMLSICNSASGWAKADRDSKEMAENEHPAIMPFAPLTMLFLSLFSYSRYCNHGSPSSSLLSLPKEQALH